MTVSQMQVIGFGVAGLGLAVAADRAHALEEWLGRGLRFIDGSSADAPWRSLRYAINANSDAADFLTGIRADGVFGDLLRGRHGRLLVQHGTGPVDLRLVAAFFDELAQRLRQLAAGHPRSVIQHRSRVSKIVLERDQSVSSFGAAGELIARSRCAVLALGAEQPVARFTRLFFPGAGRACVLASDQVLRAEADEQIASVLERGMRIVIAGGSHSGFSCAQYLLERFAGRLGARQIVIANRHPVRRYYRSAAHAGAMPLADASIDPLTGQVNRLSGIRGDALALWERISDGREQRVVLDPGAACLHQPQPDGSTGLVIYAAGYEPRRIPVVDAAGHRIPVAYGRSNALTTASGNLTTETGRVLESLYGLGLGHALPGADGYQVGVNYFHGEAAGRILQRAAPRAPLQQSTHEVKHHHVETIV
jgi:hypothetical protein